MQIHAAEMSAIQEQATARRILKLEDDLRSTLGTVPACQELLRQTVVGGRTRHDAVDRLGRAERLARGVSLDPILLARAAAEWDEAQALRWQLAMSAMRIVRREARRVPSHRVSVDDLEQEAVLGLFGAAERFDPDQGVRFAVYARWWVRAQITRSIQLGSVFQISASALELHRNARKVIASDEQEGLVRPVSELAAELGVGERRLTDVMAASALRAVEGASDDDTVSVIAELPDRDAPSPEDAVAASELAVRLRATIESTFALRERTILHRRYGLGTEAVSVAAIALDLSLSSERVRQLETQCVDALRGVFAREMDV